jgi:hypothetical protein
MKLSLPIAQVVAVTPLMLKHGNGEDASLVPATSLTFRGPIEPKQLEELREGLSDRFFEPASGKAPRVPAIPELDGAIGWKTEYEGFTLALDLSELEDLDFEDENLTITGVDAKGISFEPLATGMVDFKINAIVQTDDVELRGKLNALLRHTVRATFSRLTQKPLAEPKKAGDDAATSAQQSLAITH